MTIAIVVQNYLPFIGGVETHARQVAHELVRKGHDVRILATNFKPSTLSPRLRVLEYNLLAHIHANYDDQGIPVCALTPRGTLDRVRMLPIGVRATPKLASMAFHGLEKFGYTFYRQTYAARMREFLRGVDVVHAMVHGYIGWVTESAATSLGIPTVCTPFVHPQQWGDGPNDRAFYKRCAAVIGLVPSDTQYLASLGIASPELHTIGVSPDLPKSVDGAAFRGRHGLGDAPIVLYVGRMMPQKGASALAAAAPIVWDTHPETRFVFIGPGSDDEIAVFSGADPRISYLGKVSAQEKADALAACTVFCMPSMSEILPTVYLEAWSLGKPVVGGMAHGLPELVEGNGGGLASTQEPGTLAAALLRLLGDESLRLRCGQAGQALVEARYTTEAVTDQLLAVYESCRESAQDRTRAGCPGEVQEEVRA